MTFDNFESNVSFSAATFDNIAKITDVLTRAAVWRTREKGYNSWPVPFPQTELGRAISTATMHIGRLAGQVVSCMIIDHQDEPIGVLMILIRTHTFNVLRSIPGYVAKSLELQCLIMLAASLHYSLNAPYA